MPRGHRALARQRPPPLLGLALVLLSGCLDPIGPGTITPGKGVVYGHVRRWCGAQDPLAGAEISIDDSVRARTDGTGFYRVEVSAGKPHIMAADVAGYVHAETVVTVAAGESREQRFGLQAPGDASTSVQLDVLFVIDNSAGMGPWQDALVTAFPEKLAGILEGSTGSSLDLHLGFVTTDMGAGKFTLPGCKGDGGLLQLQPVGDAGACTRAPLVLGNQYPYLSYHRDPAGTVTTNFEGSLADAFACYAPLGTDGCRFPMPLAAMARAISPTTAENVGFLHDGATAPLLIVIVTDRDDCSVPEQPEQSDLFDPYQTEPSSTLGPFTTYRCFEFGVTCDGEPPGRTAGERSACAPGEPDPQHALVPIDTYSRLLYEDRVNAIPKLQPAILGVIAGAAAPVTVALDADDYPRLQPSCYLKSGVGADPAIRLNYVATQLATTNTICSNKDPGWSELLRSLGDQAVTQAVAARDCGP